MFHLQPLHTAVVGDGVATTFTAEDTEGMEDLVISDLEDTA